MSPYILMILHMILNVNHHSDWPDERVISSLGNGLVWSWCYAATSWTGMSLTYWGWDKMAAIFKCIFLNENVNISIKNSPKFVHKGPIEDIPALVQIMARRQPVNKPLSEPMMGNLLMHICVTDWVKSDWQSYLNCACYQGNDIWIVCCHGNDIWIVHVTMVMTSELCVAMVMTSELCVAMVMTSELCVLPWYMHQ